MALQEKNFRKDARENKEALIQAAMSAFSENGSETPLNAIAKAAGVSRATFYRNFPDRSSIVAAVLSKNVSTLEQSAITLKNSDETFYKLIEYIVHQQVEFQALLSYLPKKEGIILEQRILKLFEEPVQLAQESGKLRTDFDINNDLKLIINMLGGITISGDAQTRTIRAERALCLIKEGLFKGN
ncbi:MAG: TetR/AcrR family transcriptional regulator [Cyclobacteriaceae bacterium]